MLILSDTQARIIADSLKTITEHQQEIATILHNAQHVDLEASSTKQTTTAPVGELTGTAKVRTTKSQVKTRKSSRKGKRGVAVLTEAKVLEIKRALAARTQSVAKIAAEFGVHVTTINCIKWGKTWKHVQLSQGTPSSVEITA
jgi:hypothetical protein